MCGIAGLISTNRIDTTYGKKIVEDVQQTMFHRGPDGYSYLLEEHLLFIHRRLKIIDLDDRSNQPFVIDNGKYTIIFNGEIYNYLELKSTHLQHEEFKSTSDTEVLIKLYAKLGKDCVPLLNGIFAFAILDKERNEVFIARDQYGVKPFYYALDDHQFAFASEIKVLFKMGVTPAPDTERISEQVFYGYVAGVNTIYKNVKRLLPGHHMTIKLSGELRPITERYFDLHHHVFDSGKELTDEFVRETLYQAVKRQMVSDVPVGFMCSGGIDSSAIASIASLHNNVTIKTFCAKVEEDQFDESYYARLVATKIKSDHYEINTKPEAIAQLLPSLIWAHDEPLKHPNTIAIYQINKKAKEHITVLLTGEGADEIFAGYYIFPLMSKVQLIRKLVPDFVIRLTIKLLYQFGRQSKLLSATLAEKDSDLIVQGGSSMNLNQHTHLLPHLKLDLSERTRFAEECISSTKSDLFQAFLYYYQKVHLVSLFDRQDKMSMINAIEGRVPFLDLDLVKVANSISKKRKVKGSTTKVILRKLVKDLLPQEILDRPKYPFALPIVKWSKKSDEFRALLASVKTGYLVKKGLLNESEYTNLLDRFLGGEIALSDIIWNILNLDLSYRIFIENEKLVNMDEFLVYQTKLKN